MSTRTPVSYEFVDWVQQRMKERGITSQAELSRRANLTEAYVSRFFSRQTGGGPRLYEGLSRALGVSMDEMLQRAGVLRTGDTLPQARDWSARLRALDDAERFAAIAAMESVLSAVEASRRQRR